VTIDTHAHVWGTRDDYPWVKPDRGPPGATEVAYTIEDYREEMEDLDVDRAILVATSIHGRGNPYIRECVSNDPETFRGIVRIRYTVDDVESRVEETLGERGILGYRIVRDELTQPGMAPFYQAVNDRGGQVHLIVRPDQLSDVDDLADRYPEMVFVVDHLGSPDVSQPPDAEPYRDIDALAAHPNVYVKLTSNPSRERYPFADLDDHLRHLLETFGPDRMAWGSDHIFRFKRVLPWQTLEFLEDRPYLSTGDRRQICHRTPAELL